MLLCDVRTYICFFRSSESEANKQISSPFGQNYVTNLEPPLTLPASEFKYTEQQLSLTAPQHEDPQHILPRPSYVHTTLSLKSVPAEDVDEEEDEMIPAVQPLE